MTMRLTGAAVLAALVLGGAAAQAAPFTNGDFETGPVIASGDSVFLPGGTTTVTGWTVLGNTQTGVDYVKAPNPVLGTRSIRLLGPGNLGRGSPAGIEQTFDVTTGTLYKVTFSVYAESLQDDEFFVDVLLGNTTDITGNGVDKVNVAGAWVTYSYTGLAAGPLATIRFTAQGNGFGPYVDNVTLSVVPGPFALPLFLSALGALGLAGRRRRSAAA